MATNREHASGNHLELDVSGSNGSGTGDLNLSGDPGAVGQVPFVCLTDEDGTTGVATVATEGVFRLAVTGADNAGNTAITAGDKVFWDDTPGEVNADDVDGVPFGYALEDVASGATTTINVRLQPGA